MTVALLYCSSSPFCAAPKHGMLISPSKLLPLFSQGCSVDFGRAEPAGENASEYNLAPWQTAESFTEARTPLRRFEM